MTKQRTKNGVIDPVHLANVLVWEKWFNNVLLFKSGNLTLKIKFKSVLEIENYEGEVYSRSSLSPQHGGSREIV